jgi:hypothetical protein
LVRSLHETQRGHQERHERLDAFAFSEDLSPGYSKRPAMAEHLSPGDETGATGGCEEVDCVLDGENVTPGSGVGDTAKPAAVSATAPIAPP